MKKAKGVFVIIARLLKLLLFKIFAVIDFIWKKNDSLIVFGSQGGKRYFDNSRYLYEYVLKNRSDLKPYWIAKKKNNKIPGDVIVIGTLKYYVIIFFARYVFISYGMYDIGHVRFSKRTVVTQLWHGRPYKNIFFKSKKLTYSEKLVLKSEVVSYDYFIVSDENEKKHVIDCTGMPENKVIVTGYPRHDILSNGIVENKGFKQLSEKYTRVITYAPTFRDSSFSPFSLISTSEWEELLRFCETKDYLLILRAHASEFISYGAGYNNIRENLSSSENIFFADNLKFPDVQDVLLVTDLLISDYSGIAYDYSLISKNIIRFCMDIEEYKEERGLVDGFEDLLPGPICKSFEDFLQNLHNHQLRKSKNNLSGIFSRCPLILQKIGIGS